MNVKWFVLSVLALVIVPLLVIGCTGGSAPTTTTDTTITLSAAFSADAVQGAAPFSVKFSNSSSDSDEYRWDFGDGSKATTNSLSEGPAHQYNRAGTYTVTVTAIKGGESATSTGTTISVTAGKLANVIVQPSSAVLDIAQSQEIELTCEDEYGNPIESFQVNWDISPGVGTFQAGTFTTGTKSGAFTKALTASVRSGDSSVITSIDITINPDPLANIVLDHMEVPANGQAQLEFVATDKYGNLIEGLSGLWTLDDQSAGSLTPGGVLRAVKKAGVHASAITVSVKQGLVEKTATGTVTIIPAGLDQLFIAPQDSQLGIGKSQEYVTAGADEFGNRITDLTVAWSATAAAGHFNGSTFVTGATPETYSSGITATATWNGQQKTQYADVTVLPNRIVFLGAEDDPNVYEVYIMDADGSNLTQLTFDGDNVLGVTSSPDGRRIAYVTDTDMYIMNTEGAWRTKVIADSSLFDLSWSPDGTTVVYDVWGDDGSVNIYALDVASGETRNLTDNPSMNFSPCYSPDGKKIAFVKAPANSSSTTNEIYVMNADGSNEVRLINDAWPDWEPNWTPDSKKIIYSSARYGYYGLYKVNPDGSNLEFFITPNDKALRWPDYSPDETQIVISWGSVSYGWDISIINADSTGLTRLINYDWDTIKAVWMKRMTGVPVSADSISIPDKTGSANEMTRQEVTEAYKNAVVRIETDLGEGSGFVIKSDGTILTAAHVVRDAEEITVYLAAGPSYTGTVLVIDTEHDIALVKIDASGLSIIEIVASNGGQLGQQVIVLGYPLGNDNVTVTSGIISSFEYDSGTNIHWVQTDSAVNPGNSGGPVLNLYGQLVGMVTAKAVGFGVEGVGYAISAETLLLYLDGLSE